MTKKLLSSALILSFLTMNAKAQTGNVGINTTNPTAQLHVSGLPASANPTFKVNITPASENTPEFFVQQNNGYVGINMPVGTLRDRVHIGSGSIRIDNPTLEDNGVIFSGAGALLHRKFNRYNPSANPSNIVIDLATNSTGLMLSTLAPNAAITDKNGYIFINTGDGKVGIGDYAPTHKLTVNGDVKAANFISATRTYPDYVLEDYVYGKSQLLETYKRESLSDVESFIIKNKHLPGVTSINELEKDKNGEHLIDMSKLQMQTLEKVEELYLHLIEKEKEIKSLQERLQKLEGKKNRKVLGLF